MLHAANRTDLSYIAQSGGWRLFLRGAEPELSSILLTVKELPAGHSPALTLAQAFVYAKHGRPEAARRALDSVRSEADEQTEQGVDVLRNLALVDAHVRAYEDRPIGAQEAERLQWALQVLDETDHVGQAFAQNGLCNYSLHMGHFDKAQEHAENAIRLFREGGAEFGSLHLHTHLGQIKLIRGDIEGADAQYVELEARLAQLPYNTDGLMAVTRALRSEVAYEMNALSQSEAHLAKAMQSVEEDDAWLDILAAAYRVRTRLAFVRSGLPGALTELAHCERMAQTRDMPRLHRLLQVERIRVLTLSGEITEAMDIMRAIGLDPKRQWDGREDWALRQGTTAVAIARWLVRARRAPGALAFIAPAEDFAIRGGQLLSLAKLRVIRAAAHWRLKQKTDATGALLSALRLLGHQPFRRFILDEGQTVLQVVQAVLDGDHVSVPPNPAQRRRLSELSHDWVTGAAHGSAADRPRVDADAAGSDLANKYLELLSLGLTNKEIGRTMGVSVNTVKYHLKGVFRDLRVQNRTSAVAEARRLRIISGD